VYVSLRHKVELKAADFRERKMVEPETMKVWEIQNGQTGINAGRSSSNKLNIA